MTDCHPERQSAKRNGKSCPDTKKIRSSIRTAIGGTGKESQKASVTVSGRFPEKTIRIFTDKYNAYSGKHNFLCNTGYQKDERQSITLTFEKTGVYSFDDLRIVCQPMSRIDSQIENLKEEVF